MKVLIAAYPSVTLLGGGLLSQVRSTASALKDRGIEVEFFDPWREIDVEAFDLCHLFGANIGTHHTAATLHRRGVRTVVTPIFFTRRSPGVVRATIRVNRGLQRLARGVWTDFGLAADICRWATRVLPNTQDEARLVREGLGIGGEKVQVIPNGVDKRFLQADPALFTKTYGLEGFILSVGFFGMERKNTLRLLQALREIDRPAVLIGGNWGGSYAERCFRMASGMKGLTLLDPLPPDSSLLASAYAACEVFVLPSLYETPGIAALEAALAGAKVVITPFGGTRDYFGDLVEYCDPCSVGSIREGINRALRKERGKELQDRILREYSWGRVAEKTETAYRDVLRE